MAKNPSIARRVRPYLLGLATSLVLLIILDYKSILLSLGQFLIVKEEELHPVDVIHVLGGRSERTHYALQLYRQGQGRKLFFTGEEIAPLLKVYTIEQGIPTEDVIGLESKAINTYQEALELKYLLENDSTLRSVIVISSPYHMRRVRWTFAQVLGDQVDIQFAPVPFDRSKDERQWWTDQKSQKKVVSEYIRLCAYWLKYRSGESDLPD